MISGADQKRIQTSRNGWGANFQKLPNFYIYTDFIINIY